MIKFKNLLYLVFLLFIVVLITGCNNNTNKKNIVYNGDIIDFSYNCGSYNGGIYEYKIYLKDDKYIFDVKAYDGIDLSVNKEIDKKDVIILNDVINKSGISNWNGFDKSDSDILDGYGFKISIKYSDEKELNVHGYEKYPEKYKERIKKLDDILENIMLKK